MKDTLRNFISISIIIMCVCACGNHAGGPVLPIAKKGRIDLTQWNFSTDGPIALTGEFEFYWNQLLSSEKFSQNNGSLNPGYIVVPAWWNGYIHKGKTIKGEGYGTYRLLVKIDPKVDALAMNTFEMSSAYTIFINGDTISSAGVVGTTKKTAVPGYKPEIVDFKVDRNILDIVIQVSNFSHRIGGAWEPLTLGTRSQLQKIKEKKIAVNLLLFGSIIIIGLYHLGIYSLRRSEWSTFFFGLFCLIIALRILFTGERYILLIFPGLSYELIGKIEYLTFYLAVPAFLHYFYALFRVRLSKAILITATALSLFLSLTVVLFPVKIFSHSLVFYQLFTVALFIYATVILVMASLNKEVKAIIFLAGFSMLFFMSVNDMLYAQNIIRANYMVQFGLFIFVFSQAYLLSRYFSDAFQTIEDQHMKLAENERLLKETNLYLENRVKERTSEILKTNKNLKREIDERKSAQKVMWNAKKAAEIANRSKSVFLANMSHELRTPMNHIIGFTELIIDQHFGKLNDVQKEYLNDVHRSAEHLLSIINDILDLSKVEAGKFVFHPEPMAIQPVLSGSLNMIKEKAMKKKIETSCQSDPDLPDSIVADKRMINQILYNLLFNAVKFTPDGGYIKLCAENAKPGSLPASTSDKSADKALLISVCDTGIGLKKENIGMIFRPFEQVERAASRRYQGTGLGLSLSKKFVELHGGRLWAESPGENQGTVFYFTIPEKQQTQ